MSDAVQNTEAKAADREAGLEGIGCSRRRTEDARFIQGKGTYVDDVKLPGMLFGDFVRSPYGHARIKRSEEHTSELQSLMRISYAVFCLKKKNNKTTTRA